MSSLVKSRSIALMIQQILKYTFWYLASASNVHGINRTLYSHFYSTDNKMFQKHFFFSYTLSDWFNKQWTTPLDQWAGPYYGVNKAHYCPFKFNWWSFQLSKHLQDIAGRKWWKVEHAMASNCQHALCMLNYSHT